MWTRRILLVVSIVVVAALGSFAVRAMKSQEGDVAGATAGRLAPCPESPNCVSSQATDEKHRIDPIAVDGDLAEAMARLAEIVDGMPRSRVISAGDSYLHSQHTSRIFRFVDDLELLADPAAGVVHVRSASRVGHSDLGANRRRVEELRRRWRQAGGGGEAAGGD